MYLVYNIDLIHHLCNESKKSNVSYKLDRRYIKNLVNNLLLEFV